MTCRYLGHAVSEVVEVNTFEAPPRSPRFDSLPAPFVPRLPSPAKLQTVATAQPVIPLVAKVEVHAPPPSRPGSMTPPPRQATPTAVHWQRPRLAIRIVKRVVAMVVLMGVVTGGVFVYQHFRVQPPPHPSAWDPRVATVATFVEQQRALEFQHPIYVDFLSNTEFQLAAAAGGTSVTAKERATAQRTSEMLDAFGLAAGYDALAAESVLSSWNTLGFYSPVTDRITVRGTELTPAVRVVLAHELTHALQAQHFGMHLGGADDLARRSVSEADAMRVEGAFLASLPPEEQALAYTGGTMSPEALSTLATLPWPVVELRNAPYQLGPSVVQEAYNRNGNTGVDELFREPPTERVLLSPWRFDQPTADVEVTAEAPPATKVEQPSTPLSMMQVVVMLDAWLPWSMARGAVDHWSGGAYTLYRDTSTSPLCAALKVELDVNATAFADAIRWWAGASGSVATPIVQGSTVSFETCARGVTATAPPIPVVSPTAEILLENAAVPVGSEVNGLRDATPFLCTARMLIDDPNVAPLLVKTAPSPEEQAVIAGARDNAVRTCTQ